MLASLLMVAFLLAPAQATPEGRIGGRVVDAATGGGPAGGAEVYLQARLEDGFQVVGHAVADPEGRFLFEGLPLDPDLVYLPGASRDGVVYPGPRVRVGPDRPSAEVVIQVTGSARGPSPLVLRRFEATLSFEPGALRVAETLVIENPTPATYVGEGATEEAAPATLRLHIPPEFERITFAEEFHGRQFAIRDNQPETTLPWPPGRRELRYTYVVPDDGTRRDWTRALDLPCDQVTVTVNRAGATSPLGAGTPSEDGGVRFASSRRLPTGHVLRIAVNHATGSAWLDARWITAGLLLLAIAGSSVALARARRTTPVAATAAPHRPRGVRTAGRR